jgi:hypothetical protein
LKAAEVYQLLDAPRVVLHGERAVAALKVAVQEVLQLQLQPVLHGERAVAALKVHEQDHRRLIDEGRRSGRRNCAPVQDAR